MIDLRFDTAQLTNGPRLHYAEHGDATGSPVVFLHGWPDSWFSFSRVLALLPRDLHAFVLDQRGFGDSDRPAAGYRVDDFAADVVKFLDAVSVRRVHLVGHSFGSFVARQVAVTYPNRVASLVLIGTGWTASNPITRDVQAAMRDIPDPIPREFARDFQASTAYVPLPESFFTRIVDESMKLPARLWREVFDHLLAHDHVGPLARIAAPTLLLWGDRDALFPREDQNRVMATIPAAEIVIYPETGHCPNWECPERVATDVTAFLTRR
jgi:non-heme chloroperoxidase